MPGSGLSLDQTPNESTAAQEAANEIVTTVEPTSGSNADEPVATLSSLPDEELADATLDNQSEVRSNGTTATTEFNENEMPTEVVEQKTVYTRMPMTLPTVRPSVGQDESRSMEPSTRNDVKPLIDYKWSVMPYFSLDRSDYILDELDFLSSTYGIYNIQINEPKALRYTVGARVGYEFYPGLSLQTGFMYSKKGTMTGEVAMTYPDGYSGLATYNLSGKYFEIPALLKFSSETAYFDWYVMGGAHFQLNVASEDNYFEFTDWQEAQFYHLELGGASMGVALHLAAGIEYNINPRLSVFVEPSFSYNLHPVIKLDNFDKMPVNPNINTLGLGTGLIVKF